MTLDTALQELEATGRPIRVGMVGAGATGRAIALQLATPVPGIRLVAIANRTLEHGERAFREAGIASWQRAESVRETESAIARGLPALIDDPSVLAECGAVDIIVEVTGTVEAGTQVALAAFRHGKHVVLVNAELDSPWPHSQGQGREAGVVVTHTDGDEPGCDDLLLSPVAGLSLSPPVTSGHGRPLSEPGNPAGIRGQK